MEKDNRSAREQARREFNADVRDLARFVRKRDKRYERLLAEQKAAQETRETLARVRRKEAQLAEMKEFEEQSWMRVEERPQEPLFTDDEQELVEGDADSDEDQVVQEFYCVACEKPFKSEKQ